MIEDETQTHQGAAARKRNIANGGPSTTDDVGGAGVGGGGNGWQTPSPFSMASDTSADPIEAAIEKLPSWIDQLGGIRALVPGG